MVKLLEGTTIQEKLEQLAEELEICKMNYGVENFLITEKDGKTGIKKYLLYGIDLEITNGMVLFRDLLGIIESMDICMARLFLLDSITTITQAEDGIDNMISYKIKLGDKDYIKIDPVF